MQLKIYLLALFSSYDFDNYLFNAEAAAASTTNTTLNISNWTLHTYICIYVLYLQMHLSESLLGYLFATVYVYIGVWVSTYAPFSAVPNEKRNRVKLYV